MKSDNLAEIKLKNKSIQASYDELPYFYHVSEGVHPTNLSMIGQLHGLSTPDPHNCRVLELACGRGVNIISIANSLPNSECFGIELSEQHLEGAEQLASSLGLNNLHFQQQDIMDVGNDIGKFDYIIVYGTYSWVPSKVQDQILRLCANHLSEQGLALVHYAANPGSVLQKAVRNMMKYHLKTYVTPQDRFEAGMEFASFFVKHAPENNIYAQYLRQIQQSSLPFQHNFYHESLGEASSALYFEEFIERAAEVDLRYVDDSHFGHYMGLSDDARAELKQVPDLIRREQYLDFLLNRRSRSSILCHANRSVRQLIHPKYYSGLYFGSSAKAKCDDEGNTKKISETVFKMPNDAELSVGTPLLSACLMVLEEHWPHNILLDDLVNQARKLLLENGIDVSDGVVAEHKGVAARLLELARIGVCDIALKKNKCLTEISTKPKANQLSRLLAALRGQQSVVVNTKHQNVKVDSFSMYVLELLNGDRTRDEIINELLAKHESGVMKIKQKDKSVDDKGTARELLEQMLEEKLNTFLMTSLLVD